MTIEEFKNKYYPVTYGKGIHQASWDLFEKIEETLDSDSDLETKISSCLYKTSTLLEICNPDLPDYEYINKMNKDIDYIH